jgi:acylglycerol lipase
MMTGATGFLARRRVVAFLTGVAVVGWVGYRLVNERSETRRITIDTACRSDSATVADLTGLVAGAAAVRCEPWDIGTGVTGYVWRAPNPRAALLLQPGWGDYAQRYVRHASQLIPHLVMRGISVYAFDMWGNGRSPGKRGASDLDDAVADHLAARRKLRDQRLPIFVLGHSVGGLVTATSALDDPAGLDGMILVAPAIDWSANGAMRIIARVGGFLVPTLRVPGPSGSAALTRDPEARRRMDEDPLMVHGLVSWLTASDGVTMSSENWARYQAMRVPLLVLHGTADRTPRSSSSQALVARVGSQDKTLSLLPGGLPDARRIMLEWLDGRLRR